MIKKVKGGYKATTETKKTIDYIFQIVNNLNEMETLLERFKV